MRIIISLVLLASFCSVAAAQGEEPEFKMPKVPETASSPEGFVPAGWRAMEKLRGDLNGDGSQDAVVVAESASVTGEPSENWQLPRLLIIAFAGSDGSLRLSTVSDKAVMCRGCGGMMGNPLAAIAVKGGVIVIDHYGGSRDRWAFTDRFRFQDGAWAHIGETHIGTDTLDLDYSKERDANLSTGLVVESGKQGRKSYRRTFYELRAGRVERAPTVDGLLSDGEWPGPSVRVNLKENVVEGVAAWSGAEDASARVSAVFREGELYVSAEVSDDSVTDGDVLRLISKTGQVVRAIEVKRSTRAGGYAVEARYALKGLGLEEIEARIKEIKGYGATDADIPTDRWLRLSVEIVDADAGQKTPTVLSTSRGGRKYPARVRLTPHTGTPLLKNFDREKSADVMSDGAPFSDEP